MASLEFDESDQASIVGCIYNAHLKTHKDNKPDPECAFCKAFLISDSLPENGYPLQSYSFMILDVSEPNPGKDGI